MRRYMKRTGMFEHNVAISLIRTLAVEVGKGVPPAVCLFESGTMLARSRPANRWVAFVVTMGGVHRMRKHWFLGDRKYGTHIALVVIAAAHYCRMHPSRRAHAGC